MALDDNPGDYDAFVICYSGDGSHFNFGVFMLCSPRYSEKFYIVQVWEGRPHAACITNNVDLSGYATQDWVKTNFQDGVDSIYNELDITGATPYSKTPRDIVQAITAMRYLLANIGHLSIMTGYMTLCHRFRNSWEGNCYIVVGAPCNAQVYPSTWYEISSYGLRIVCDNDWSMMVGNHREPGSTDGLGTNGTILGKVYTTPATYPSIVVLCAFPHSGNYFVYTAVIVSNIFSSVTLLDTWRSQDIHIEST